MSALPPDRVLLPHWTFSCRSSADSPVQAHPLADLFPLVLGDEFDALVADIRAHGLRVPITIFEDKVLDGRNRLAACLAAEVEPRFERFDGTEDEALTLVVSLNLARRHLTTAQRAALAVKLLPLDEDAARRRMHAGRPPSTEDPPQDVAELPGPLNGEANALAGKRVGISKETVRKAKKLAEAHPAVFSAMQDGTIRTLGEAERLAALKPERRERVLTRMRDEGVSLKQAEEVKAVWSRASASAEWYTPEPLLSAARRAMGGDFDLDPASHAEAQITVQAARYFTAQDDGLRPEWVADRIWCNPPYGVEDDGRARQGVWVDKLLAEFDSRRTKQACLLVRAATETLWFGKLWRFPICFIRGRVHFVPGPGATEARPTISSALVGVGVDHDAFIEAFREIGQVVLPSRCSGIGIAGSEMLTQPGQ